MRLPVPNPEQYTPRQKEVVDKHVSRRDHLGGPYKVWIHSPDMFEKASAISNYMRCDCGLPVKLREFGILVMSRYLYCVNKYGMLPTSSYILGDLSWEADWKHALNATPRR